MFYVSLLTERAYYGLFQYFLLLCANLSNICGTNERNVSKKQLYSNMA